MPIKQNNTQVCARGARDSYKFLILFVFVLREGQGKGQTSAADKKIQEQNKKLVEAHRKKDEELKKFKEAAAGKTPSEDADGDASMEPDGPDEKEKRAFIKARISIYEARAKMSKQMAPEHRIEEDDAYTQTQLAYYTGELASLLPPSQAESRPGRTSS